MKRKVEKVRYYKYTKNELAKKLGLSGKIDFIYSRFDMSNIRIRTVEVVRE